MLEPIKPLAGQAVFLLLVQLSLLVAVARVGAVNRAIQHRLFFGYESERLIRAARVPVVVVPNLRRLAGPPS
jgi:hypothetical protein